MNKIADLWQYAEQVTHEQKSKEDSILTKDSINFQILNNDTDYGWIAEFEDRIVIAFRGTRGKLKPWIENFIVYPLNNDNTFKFGTWGEGTIHNGFYQSWKNFKDIVTKYFKNSDCKKPIFCTGHSRGAVLATLCSRHIAKNLKIPCSCINFGSPLIGNNKFRDEYNQLPINCTRVKNGFDVVSSVPPEAFGFRHVGNLLNLKEPWWHWFNRIKEHYYQEYTKAIMRYSKDKNDIEGYNAMVETLKNCL